MSLSKKSAKSCYTNIIKISHYFQNFTNEFAAVHFRKLTQAAEFTISV